MAGDELTQEKLKEALASGNAATPAIPNPTPPPKDHVGPIMAQRIRHREILFWFCIGFTVIAFAIVGGSLAIQAFFEAKYQIKIFSDATLQLIIGTMFVQILGLLLIITRALWNDKDYLAFLK